MSRDGAGCVVEMGLYPLTDLSGGHVAAVEATQAAALALTARQIDECGCPGCPNKAPEDEAGRSQPEQSSQSLKG